MNESNLSHDILIKVHVAKPCPANWREMRGNDQVRHCTHCSKNVYNLSALSRTEAAALIEKHEGRVCVRFYSRPDGTILAQDCGKPLRQPIRYGRVGIAILGILGLGSVVAANSLSVSDHQLGNAVIGGRINDWQVAVLRFFGVATPSTTMGDVSVPTTGKLSVKCAAPTTPVKARVTKASAPKPPTKPSNKGKKSS